MPRDVNAKQSQEMADMDMETAGGNSNSDSGSSSDGSSRGTPPPQTFPTAERVGAGAARRVGGVRSVRDGGSVNVNSNMSMRKAFSTNPSSSFLPRAGSGTRLPAASAPVPNGSGQNNAFSRSTVAMFM